MWKRGSGVVSSSGPGAACFRQSPAAAAHECCWRDRRATRETEADRPGYGWGEGEGQGQGQWPTGRVRARARARVRVRVGVGRRRVVLHDGEGRATRDGLAQQPLYLEVELAWLGVGLGFGWG
eukprot:scaffold120693_cov60-Phaeocystis_antarctica.AAC.1